MEETLNIERREYHHHYYSADILRLCMILCLILARYGVPVYSGLVTPFLGFAAGTLFTLYGYFVLRDGKDLKDNIKHCAKVFGIMFVVFFILATVYMWLVYGAPFAYLTKRGIFNFVVLNYWGPSMGEHIWMVQSTLYALIICYIFRKLKKYDVLFCIILFMFAFIVGEGAGIIKFNVLGYTYIPGNFLTRTLPYMLLGRIMYRNKIKLINWKMPVFFMMIVVGLGLSVLELIGFSKLGILVYYGHLTGFILITFALVGLSMIDRHFGMEFVNKHPEIYKKAYFVYNPIGEILMIVLTMLVSSQTEYVEATMISGVLVCFVTLFVALIDRDSFRGLDIFFKDMKERKERKKYSHQKHKEEQSDE